MLTFNPITKSVLLAFVRVLLYIIPTSDLNQEYATYNEEDLMVILQFKDDSPEDAKDALEILYIRFNEKLITACINRLKFHGNDIGHAADIIYNTWWRIKNKPQNYKPEEAKGKTPKEKVYRFFHGIIKIEYANWFNGRGLPEENEYHIIYNLDDDSKYTNETLKAIKQLLNESKITLSILNEAEKAIFFTYLEYRPEGKKIPRTVRRMLAERFGLYGDDSVTTYFNRAKRKIKEYYTALNG